MSDDSDLIILFVLFFIIGIAIGIMGFGAWIDSNSFTIDEVTITDCVPWLGTAVRCDMHGDDMGRSLVSGIDLEPMKGSLILSCDETNVMYDISGGCFLAIREDETDKPIPISNILPFPPEWDWPYTPE